MKRLGIAVLVVVFAILTYAISASADTSSVTGAEDCPGGVATLTTLRSFVVCEDASHDKAQAALKQRVSVLEVEVTNLTTTVNNLTIKVNKLSKDHDRDHGDDPDTDR